MRLITALAFPAVFSVSKLTIGYGMAEQVPGRIIHEVDTACVALSSFRK